MRVTGGHGQRECSQPTRGARARACGHARSRFRAAVNLESSGARERGGSCYFFTSCIQHEVHVIAALHLLNQSVLDSTCVLIKECRSFCAKVLQNLKACVADLAEVCVRSAYALTLALQFADQLSLLTAQ